MSETPETSPTPDAAHDCADCPIADRRGFLRDAAVLAAGAFLSLGATPRRAQAFAVHFGSALRRSGDEHTYAIPAADGAVIDKDAEVIVARYQGRAYAFDLSCPHQHTALRWQPEDGRFQCPKHKSKYRPDGVYMSGRATRSMDRHALRRDGANLVVDLTRVFREDKQPQDWAAAFVPV